jgi:hypothetical protein
MGPDLPNFASKNRPYWIVSGLLFDKKGVDCGFVAVTDILPQALTLSTSQAKLLFVAAFATYSSSFYTKPDG